MPLPVTFALLKLQFQAITTINTSAILAFERKELRRSWRFEIHYGENDNASGLVLRDSKLTAYGWFFQRPGGFVGIHNERGAQVLKAQAHHCCQGVTNKARSLSSMVLCRLVENISSHNVAL